MVRVLVLPGSARQGSLNTRLAHAAAASVTKAGGDPTIVDLRELAMPIYDGDLEAAQGIPPGARSLKSHFKDHDALLFCSPENNSSVSALLKNAIDWVSRQDGDESGLVPFQGKVALLTAASPGALGGLRGLRHLRETLEGLGVLVLPQTLAVSAADKAFGPDGLLDARRQDTLDKLASRLVATTDRLAPRG
ncbi:MAG: NAD(P)H-dependent oxidoreductase [Zoogloeaceae bacterium]|nr:NAD(P)H-dependent oxidoreductase [Zoogloeaceae bacterium]